MNDTETRNAVTGVLALALGLGFVIVAGGAVALSLTSSEDISRTAANVLTALAGGIVGVLGAMIGYSRGYNTGRGSVNTPSGFSEGYAGPDPGDTPTSVPNGPEGYRGPIDPSNPD